MTKFAVILGFAGALALVGCGSDDNGGSNPGADLSQCKASCDSIFANAPSSAAACYTQCEQNNNNPDNPPPVTLMDSGVDPGGNDASTNPPRTCASLAYPLDQLGAKGVCGAETAGCLAACQDNACFNTCLQNDTGTPATYMGQELGCDFCISNQQIACLAANGCAAEVNDLSCCYADSQAVCASKATPAEQQSCIQAACGAQNTAINTCFQAKAGAACADVSGAAYADCYAAPVTP